MKESGYLDGKLECKTCGTITMVIPEGAGESTLIQCSKCGGLLGTWGELQDEFMREARNIDVLELKGGRIRKTKAGFRGPRKRA
ncbi:hypothetical protein [Pseudaminobacter sp. NGMCC 1.201702]|uniref:hypothetical protein n=1 Tax=Pseudaminobacter sp. NGMCC 1.201702 TaxID=3391825 RepID=UPI0039EEDC6F